MKRKIYKYLEFINEDIISNIRKSPINKSILVAGATILTFADAVAAVKQGQDPDEVRLEIEDDEERQKFDEYIESNDITSNDITRKTVKKTVYLQVDLVSVDSVNFIKNKLSVGLAGSPKEVGAPYPGLTLSKSEINDIIFDKYGAPWKAKGPVGDKIIKDAMAKVDESEKKLLDNKTEIEKDIKKLKNFDMSILKGTNIVIRVVNGFPYRIGEITPFLPTSKSKYEFLVLAKIPVRQQIKANNVNKVEAGDYITVSTPQSELAKFGNSHKELIAHKVYGKKYSELPQQIKNMINESLKPSKNPGNYVNYENKAFWVSPEEFKYMENMGITLCDESILNADDYLDILNDFYNFIEN